MVLRVLAYAPKVAIPGMRVRIQACEPSGAPIAEDPLVQGDGFDAREVEALVCASERDGWTFIPRLAPPWVS